MINSVQSRWFFFPLLVLSLQQGWAQAPSGTQFFQFSGQNTAVYDLSNPSGYQLDQNIVGAGGTLMPLTIGPVPLNHNPGGRLVGVGETTVTVGSDEPFAAHYIVNGRVSGGGNQPTRVQFSISLTGNDFVSGVQTPFNIAIRYNLQVDPTGPTLIGKARGHASFRKLGGANISSADMSVGLPPQDGTWTAVLNVQALNNLAGSGTLTLSTGRPLPVKLNGSFANASQRARLHLTGTTHQDFGQDLLDGRGSSVQMNFFSGASGPDQMHGMILGQKVLIQ